jgi:hypothetical protein
MYLDIAGRRLGHLGPGEAQRCGAANAKIRPWRRRQRAAATEKGKLAMFEDDDDARAEMARSLAESGDSQAAAEAFRAIAVDGGVDDTVRLEAARGLAEIDERAAAQACCAIAVDGGVDDTVRLEAAMLAQGDSRWAAAAFRAIAVDGGVDDTVRHEAARGLAEIG